MHINAHLNRPDRRQNKLLPSDANHRGVHLHRVMTYVQSQQSLFRSSLDNAGLLKGFHGISASVTASVFAGFFAGNMASFLLFLALGPSLLGLIALVFLDRIPNYRPAMLEKSGMRGPMILCCFSLVLSF